MNRKNISPHFFFLWFNYWIIGKSMKILFFDVNTSFSDHSSKSLVGFNYQIEANHILRGEKTNYCFKKELTYFLLEIWFSFLVIVEQTKRIYHLRKNKHEKTWYFHVFSAVQKTKFFFWRKQWPKKNHFMGTLKVCTLHLRGCVQCPTNI